MSTRTFDPVVDYTLRPAKALVRRLVIEAVDRVDPVTPVSQYRYIGMGSTYFRDFHLVHRRLRIDNMISLEHHQRARDRVEFNIPLSCIKLIMNSTSAAIPDLDLEKQADFIWFDYESKCNASVLADLRELIYRCVPGTFIVVSVNAEPDAEETLQEWIAGSNMDIDDVELPSDRKGVANLSYTMLAKRIEESIFARNQGKQADTTLSFEQLLHIVYKDSVQMLTFGGMLVTNEMKSALDDCRVHELEYVRQKKASFNAKMPFLTRREINYLLKLLPKGDTDAHEAARAIGISKREFRQFESIYRYAPLFVEVDDW